MIIELRGVEFVNKGAELMLYAIVDELKKVFPEAKFVMEKTGRAPISKQRKLGIYTKFKTHRYKNLVKVVNVLVPNNLLNKTGYIKEKQINVVLDASGFAFGDKWGAKKAGARMADHIVGWRKEGKKVVLLPQAFGPFNEPDLKLKMETILANASLTFARDKTSLKYIEALAPEKSSIEQKPDFTNLISGIIPKYFDATKYEVAIVPNAKMIEMTEDSEGKNYLQFLKNLVEIVQADNSIPFFLIHEGALDKKIAEQVNESLATPIPILVEDNPLKVKGIIGASKAVITSRFHGLVSALSQAVPCLATGWSHKYEMLLEDYNFSEALVDPNITKDKLAQKVQLILEPSSAQIVREKLSLNALKQKQLSKEMWNEVVHIISA